MSNTKANSRVMLTIMDRVTRAGLNIPAYKILLAISANTGTSGSEDIARATGSKFNWKVCTPMYDSKMLERMEAPRGNSRIYKYAITPYGEKVLDYIATGKGDV